MRFIQISGKILNLLQKLDHGSLEDRFIWRGDCSELRSISIYRELLNISFSLFNFCVSSYIKV